jgi:hypothetical protein
VVLADMLNTIKRELRIAFSKRGQPVWLRVVKWAVFVGVAVALFNTICFWFWVPGLPLVGIFIHLVYRFWKTHGWTRPWGGWNDVEAGR